MPSKQTVLSRTAGAALCLLLAASTVSAQQQAQAQGYWSRADVVEHSWGNQQGSDVAITGSRGRLHSKRSGVDTLRDGSTRPWSYEADFIWSDPPAVLEPNKTVTLRLATEMTQPFRGNRDEVVFKSAGSVYAQFVPPPPQTFPPYETHSGIPTAGFTPVHLQGRKDLYLDDAWALYTRGIPVYRLRVEPEKWETGSNPAKMAFDFAAQVPDQKFDRPGVSGKWLSLRVIVTQAVGRVYYYNYKWVEGTPPTPTDNDTTTTTTTPPTPPEGMILQADKRRVKAGDAVTLLVSLINGQDVANMNFTASYDPTVAVSAGPILRGNLLGGAMFEQNPAEPALMRIGYAQTGGITGTGPVAAIPFKAVGKPGDRTAVHLEVTTINNPAGARLQITRIDGEILIVGADDMVPCDCDGDAAITAADARCALQMSVGLRPVNVVMDADADKQVTSNDARLILQKVVGK